MFKFLGVIFYIVGIADFAGMFLGYDFTGQPWTPILFGAIGQLMFYIDSKVNPEKAESGEQSSPDNK